MEWIASEDSQETQSLNQGLEIDLPSLCCSCVLEMECASNELLRSGGFTLTPVCQSVSWYCVSYCQTTTLHCICLSLPSPPPPPCRNTLLQSANSRSQCSRTIMWHTPPWYIGSSSRAGAGTSVWTKKEKSWRGTMSRRTSQQPTSFPNL